jgi:hypothetical protein
MSDSNIIENTKIDIQGDLKAYIKSPLSLNCIIDKVIVYCTTEIPLNNEVLVIKDRLNQLKDE